MSVKDFNPFYERWADALKLGIVGKIFISFLPGLLFFLPYYAVVGVEALTNWSWLLALLIVASQLFLYYATDTLRRLFPVWTAHIEGGDDAFYMQPLCSILRDRNFFITALVVGCTNLGLGLLFGVDLSDPAAAGILLFGYFLAGFICGLPAMGIIGVVVTFRAFTSNQKVRLKLDYTAPDRCGGLSFFGGALVKFSVVTLLEGIMIASYILLASWMNAGNAWVQLVMWGWVVFPFFWSLLVLLVPAIDINMMLSHYRHDLEKKLGNSCQELREQIESPELSDEKREAKCSEYDYLCSRREEVHNMRTWPFSVGATTSFVGAFLSNIVLAVELARSFL